MPERIREELIALSREWDRAMVRNDADEIGRFMTDDWTIVGADGSMGGRASFLELVRSGALTHDTMESNDLDVRVYGDAAVVTAWGVSAGKVRSQAFRERERSSCFLVRQEGRWKCAWTHLSRLAPREPEE